MDDAGGQKHPDRRTPVSAEGAGTDGRCHKQQANHRSRARSKQLIEVAPRCDSISHRRHVTPSVGWWPYVSMSVSAPGVSDPAVFVVVRHALVDQGFHLRHVATLLRPGQRLGSDIFPATGVI